MSSLTDHYALTKADGAEQYDVDVVNANLDAVDAALWAQHVSKSSGFVQIAFTAGLSGPIAHGLGRVPTLVLLTQWAGASWNGVFLAVSQTAGHMDATNFRIRAKDSSNAALDGNVGLLWVAF